MAEIHTLDGALMPTLAERVNENVVEILKDALARAESGEFGGIAIAGIQRDHGGVYVQFSRCDDMVGLVAAANVLNHDVLNGWCEK
ncbi:MAG: hypothetical protein V3R81_11830 [Gammaproteobacteria bacterium]